MRALLLLRPGFVAMRGGSVRGLGAAGMLSPQPCQGPWALIGLSGPEDPLEPPPCPGMGIHVSSVQGSGRTIPYSMLIPK